MQTNPQVVGYPPGPHPGAVVGYPQTNRPAAGYGYGQDRVGFTAQFVARVNRYRRLLARRWWVPLVCVGVALGIQGFKIRSVAPVFVSYGRMIVSTKILIPEGSMYSEEMGNFLGTQAALMQSGEVLRRAQTRVTAQKPDMAVQPVTVSVNVLARTTIFVLKATGSDPQYTQAFLQACMEEYQNLKKEWRSQTSDTTLAGLTEEVLRLERDLRKIDEELVAFQTTNSVVVLEESGNTVGGTLVRLRQRVADLKSEYELLTSLTPEQNLERESRKDAVPVHEGSAAPVSTPVFDSTDPEYVKAKQQILLQKADLQDLARNLRPQHPKMIQMSEEILRRERVLDMYRTYNLEQMRSRTNSLAVQIEKLDREVKDWDVKTLEISRKMADYQRIRAKQQRTQALYDRLLATMQTVDVNKELSPESVAVMEKASTASPERPALNTALTRSALVGLVVSIALLFLLDRLDDRMNSLTELSQHFAEVVLAQIPKEKGQRARKGQKGSRRRREVALLHPEDARHGFVEAFRSIRSSILYMADSSQRPRILLVTSSVPNEGKTMTASNLAITLARGGARVLLVDADMRKGIQHERFGVAAQPGLYDALSQTMSWPEVVQPTTVPNLFLMARGATTNKSSELFIHSITQRFFKEAAASYDFVLVDSAPVMVADDVTTLAPQTDGVVFIVRAEVTSARVARAGLDLLLQRRAKIMGLVFNAVRPSTGGYYYYYKYKDYYRAHPKPAAPQKT